MRVVDRLRRKRKKSDVYKANLRGQRQQSWLEMFGNGASDA